GSEQRSREKTEQHRAPTEKRANRSQKFQIAASHCFPGNHQFASNTRNLRNIIKHDRLAFGSDAIVSKVERYVTERVMVDGGLITLEQQSIFFASKIVA